MTELGVLTVLRACTVTTAAVLLVSACAEPATTPPTATASPSSLDRGDATGRFYASTAATENGSRVEWLQEKPVTFEVSDLNGSTVLVVDSPCNALSYALEYRTSNPLQWQAEGTPGQTYLGCFAESGAQETWLRTFLEAPDTRITQSVDEIVMTNDHVEVRAKASERIELTTTS